MKKIKMILLIIITILLFWLYKNKSNFIEPYKLRSESTPAEYQNYQLLMKLATKQNSDIRLFDAPIVRSGHINGDSLIWIVEYGDSDKADSLKVDTYYKINIEGVVIDTLKVFNGHTSYINDYLINKKDNYFYSWLKDGDRTKKPIVPIHTKSTLLTEKELELHLKDAVSVCSYILRDSTTGHNVQRIIFYKNKTWYEVLTSASLYISESTPDYYEQMTFEDFEDVFTESHFTKERWCGHRFPNFNLAFNGITPENWRGTSYYNFSELNKNLKFKEPYVRLYKNELHASSTYSVYIHPSENYLIIKSGYGGSSLYLCRTQPLKEQSQLIKKKKDGHPEFPKN
jgi:hypothetical protein